MLVSVRLAVAVLALAPAARAVELDLRFGALERILAEQLFTQGGRRYVRGDKTNQCNFAISKSRTCRASTASSAFMPDSRAARR